MSLIGKTRTALQLVTRWELPMLRRQWDRNTARARLLYHGGRPFVHRDLGFPFVCHPDWPDSMSQFLGGNGDHWEFALLRAWLRPGDVVFDIGANLGLYACAALDAMPGDGTVVAVDADPDAIHRLQETARLLARPGLHAVHAAVFESDDAQEFFVRTDRTTTGEQSLRPSAEQRAGSRGVMVPGCTLRTLQLRHAPTARVSLVKIDVEGADVAAIAGAPRDWLTADGPLWIVEINPLALERFDARPSDVLTILGSESFDLWLLAKHPRNERETVALRPVHADERFDDSLYYNLFALPKGARWRDRRAALPAFFPGIEP